MTFALWLAALGLAQVPTEPAVGASSAASARPVPTACAAACGASTAARPVPAACAAACGASTAARHGLSLAHTAARTAARAAVSVRHVPALGAVSASFPIPVLANDHVYFFGFATRFAESSESAANVEAENYRVKAGLGLRVVVPVLGPLPVGLDFGFPVVNGSATSTATCVPSASTCTGATAGCAMSGCCTRASGSCPMCPVSDDCDGLPACCEKKSVDGNGAKSPEPKKEAFDDVPMSILLDVLGTALDALVDDLLDPLCPLFSASDSCRGMMLPAPHYLEHPPQYFPPPPPFALSNELMPQQRIYQPQGPQMVGQPMPAPAWNAPPMPVQMTGYPVPPIYPVPPVCGNPSDIQVCYPVQQVIQVAMPVPCAVPPTPPAVKATFKVMPKGDHHVLTIHQGDTVLVCKKTTVEVAGQDLTFTTGKERVHVHGKSFEASATKVVTKEDGTLVLEGDVHVNCDDHGKAVLFRGGKAVLGLDDDGHVRVSTVEPTH